MNDDLYPNDSSYFIPREPLEQELERKKEQAIVLEGMDFLKDMVERLQQRIDYFEKNSSIPDDVRTDTTAFMVLHNTHSMMAETLSAEKEMLQSVIDSYKR